MEYVHLGDLHKNVVAKSEKIPENEARDIAEQILLGLEIMHAESFAHRDLKPQVFCPALSLEFLLTDVDL